MTTPARRVFAVVTMLLVVVCGGLYLFAPAPVARVAYVLPMIASCVVMIVGPLVRHVRPRSAWAAEMLGAGSLLVYLALRLVPAGAGQVAGVDVADVLYFGAYLCFVTWLALLARHVGGGRGRSALLDTATITLGMGLALWCVSLAPVAGGPGLKDVTLWAIYPVVDVLLLALLVHLCLRLRRVPTVFGWATAGLAALLAADAVYAVAVAHGVTRLPWVDVAYLFTYACLALAACHPSTTEVSVPPRRAGVWPSGRPTALIFVSISPVILSTAIPVAGPVDLVVRTVLVALLVIALFARIASTMEALAGAEEASHLRATHDGLTGLLNRSALIEHMDTRLHDDALRGWFTIVLFLDCDRFKHVNDTWGHRAGDTLLREVARRLSGAFDPPAVVARHGGDEFVVVTSAGSPEAAELWATRVGEIFSTPIAVLPGRTHPMSPSVGVATCRPGDGVGAEEMLSRADIAMYAAKRGGRGRHRVFDEEMARTVEVRTVVGDRLERAIRSGDIVLAFSPIMSGPGYRDHVAWAAQARWDDPELGLVPPELFRPTAEESGLVVPLGEAMLRQAAGQALRLREVYPEVFPAVSIDVSSAQLTAPGFVEFIRSVDAASGLPPGWLTLEVSESVLVHDGPEVHEALRRLRASGIRLCLDDFGVGHASVNRLMRVPLDYVKIDGSMTTDIDRDDDARERLSAVLTLVRALRLPHIIVAGVRTAAQEAVLAELGCPLAQGDRYGAPATVEEWVLRRTPATPGAVAETGTS